jgi:hypothetical protein
MVRNKKDLFADRFKPLYISESLTFVPLVTVPKDAIAVKEKVFVLLGQLSDGGPIDLELL